MKATCTKNLDFHLTNSKVPGIYFLQLNLTTEEITKTECDLTLFLGASKEALSIKDKFGTNTGFKVIDGGIFYLQ